MKAFVRLSPSSQWQLNRELINIRIVWWCPWCGGVEITPFVEALPQRLSGSRKSLGGCELGDSLGALRHSVLGQLSRKNEPHSSLDLTRGHSGLLVVPSELCGLCGDLLEDVRDERVQDGDGTAGNSSVRVDLQQSITTSDCHGLSSHATWGYHFSWTGATHST